MEPHAAAAAARTAFVVPTWNGREQIGRALESIAAQTDADHVIVVVDNGSSDGTAELVAERFPAAILIREPRNLGFAAAVNRGIAATGSELVALVNDDVELRPDWLERARAGLEVNAAAGSVATKLLDARHPGRLDGAGDILGLDGYALRRGRGDADDGSYNEPGEVLSACAAAALYRRRALEQVGAFDERFFAYFEDVDWGLRAQLGGWSCRYEPTAVALHAAGSTSGRVPRMELYHAHRNMLWLMAKSFPTGALLIYAPLIVARRVGSLLKAALSGGGVTVLRAWWAGIRGARAIRRGQRELRTGGARRWREIRPLLRVWAR